MTTWVSSLLLILLATPAAAVEVHRQSLPGPDRIHARMTVHTSLPVLLRALESPCAIRRWLPHVKDLQVLNRRNNVTRVDLLTAFPWPWHDREAVLDFKRTGPAHGKATIRMRLDPHAPLRHSHAIRVAQSSAEWILEQSGDMVNVQYSQRMDLGGSIPQWLADRVGENKVAESLQQLKTLVENHDPTAQSLCGNAAATAGPGNG